jgi:hypothetical protein
VASCQLGKKGSLDFPRNRQGRDTQLTLQSFISAFFFENLMAVVPPLHSVGESLLFTNYKGARGTKKQEKTYTI